MGSSAPTPTCPTVSTTESQTTAHPSVGYWCDRNIRLQQLHHSDPQLIIPHIQTAATRGGRERACRWQFDPIIDRMLMEGNN